MTTWKRFTAAVDLNAQSFLKNKKFSREKRTFSWDWHAWNLALVSTPSLLLGFCLHGVEKRMEEEAAIREEIQERTGVSSRGFLIPKKDVRDEVLGMLSAGNQGRTKGAGGKGQGPGGGKGDDATGRMPADFESIERRLAAIESVLGVKGDSSSAAEANVHDRRGPVVDSTPSSATDSNRDRKAVATKTSGNEKNSGDDVAHEQSTFDWAMETASLAVSWVLTTGEREGKRLLKMGQDWMGGEKQEGVLGTEISGSKEGETAEERAPQKTLADVHKQGELAAGRTLDSVGTSNPSSERQKRADAGGESTRSTEAGWRRGKLDEIDEHR